MTNRKFWLGIQSRNAPEKWLITEAQLRALVLAIVGFGITDLEPVPRNVAEKGLAILERALAFPVLPVERHREKLLEIADFLESHGRDEGGLSNESRAELQADADLLREIAK